MSIRLPIHTGDVVPLDGPIVMQHASMVPAAAWPARPKASSVTVHIQAPLNLLGNVADRIVSGRFIRLGRAQ